MIREDIHKLNLTRQREVVLEVIRAAHEHLTAGDVFDRSRHLLPSISFATVYNSLRFLKDAGHIAEINFGSGAARYDRITSRHDHALCTECGKLVDIDLEIPQELVKSAEAYSNFKLESLEFTLKGLCPECSGNAETRTGVSVF